MGFFPTDVDENANEIQIETYVSGAINKSALAFTPNPQRCLLEGIDMIGKVARTIAVRGGNALDGTGMAFEVVFSIKIDGNGVPQLSKESGQGQLQCRLVYRDN